MRNDRTSILINKDIESVWNAIANEEKFSIWYAPGSNWKIPIFEVGKQAVFTLMPSSHNDLKDGESMSMNFTIKKVIPNQMPFTIDLTSESDGIRVQFNQEGFNYSLENLNAYLEDRELPYS